MIGNSGGIPFITDNLECLGDEDDISLCSFKGWTSSHCRDAVWLDCSKYELLLIILNEY